MAPNGESYRRLVLLSFPGGTTSAEEDKVRELLGELKSSVGGLETVWFGRDVGGRAGSYTHGIALGFRNKMALEEYLPHPTHLALGKFLRERQAEVLLLEFVDQMKV